MLVKTQDRIRFLDHVVLNNATQSEALAEAIRQIQSRNPVAIVPGADAKFSVVILGTGWNDDWDEDDDDWDDGDDWWHSTGR